MVQVMSNLDPNEPLYWTRRAVAERHLAEAPPKGSVAYDRMMQAGNPPPARRKRPDHPEYDDEYYDDYYDDYDDPHRSRFRLDAGWIIIGALAIAGLKFWPLLVIAGCAAVSRYRGPNHYTKFMVPYAYRFKWDAGWIFVTVIAVLAGLPVALELAAGRLPEGVAVGWLLLACFIALLRTVVWLCFRFPLVSWFFVMFIVMLFGIGVRFGAGRLFW